MGPKNGKWVGSGAQTMLPLSPMSNSSSRFERVSSFSSYRKEAAQGKKGK